MVYKYPLKNGGRDVNRKSTLTVKESQVAIFVHKGEIADIFTPGLYNLDTEILPILTKLASWKYAFETQISLDIYFINTVILRNRTFFISAPLQRRGNRREETDGKKQSNELFHLSSHFLFSVKRIPQSHWA
jgi:membrane protease subunit (stomatin/prohibitin family)